MSKKDQMKRGMDSLLEPTTVLNKTVKKEDENDVVMSVRVPASLHKDIKRYALENNMKIREVVIEAINKLL